MTLGRALSIPGYGLVPIWVKFSGGVAFLVAGSYPRRKPHYKYRAGEFRT